MDWPSTPAYCGAFARAFDVPLYFSWRIGGFEREMLRDSTPTAPVNWENLDGSLGQAGGKGPPGTRLRFPQVSADISVRWCSGYLKIDVGVIALRNQPRFLGKKTLFISGERAEESPCRARYKEFEMDRTSTDKRTVHRWRPIHAWREQQVWEIVRRHRYQSASGLPARLGPSFLSRVHFRPGRSMGLPQSNRPGWLFCSVGIRTGIRVHHTPEQIDRGDGSHGQPVCWLRKPATHRGGPGSELEPPHHLAGRLVAAPCWRLYQERWSRVTRTSPMNVPDPKINPAYARGHGPAKSNQVHWRRRFDFEALNLRPMKRTPRTMP